MNNATCVGYRCLTMFVFMLSFGSISHGGDLLHFGKPGTKQWSHQEAWMGHFTHESEGLWPLHFEHSRWWRKAEPVKVCFTLRLRDKWSKWLEYGCQVHLKSTWHPNGSCVHGHFGYYHKLSLGGGPNTKPGDYGTSKSHDHWFTIF